MSRIRRMFGLGPRPVAERRRGDRVWIDVGAHLGEKTLPHALADRNITVYAFEPNLEVALQLAGRSPNVIVVPAAVDLQDGCSQLFVTELDAASSLRPYDDEGKRSWRGPGLDVLRTASVPTIRLDTFLRVAHVDAVEFLKIDAQGADLAVVRSLGDRLSCVARIELEVQISPRPLYRDAASREDVMSFMVANGFELLGEERQTDDQEVNLTFARSTTAR